MNGIMSSPLNHTLLKPDDFLALVPGEVFYVSEYVHASRMLHLLKKNPEGKPLCYDLHEIKCSSDLLAFYDAKVALTIHDHCENHRVVNQTIHSLITSNDDQTLNQLLLCKHLQQSDGLLLWIFSIVPLDINNFLSDLQLSNVKHVDSNYDELTRLPNRTAFADRLLYAQSIAKRQSTSLAIVFIDLDGFKRVNDTYGHEAGDFVLVTISKRLVKLFRETDTIARFGGDEFCGIITDLNENVVPHKLLLRILETVSQDVVYQNVTHRVTCSIGVTFFPQSEDLAPDQLLRQADQAMYKAKQLGKNRFYFFDEELDRKERYQNSIIQEIEAAYKDNQFILYYLPKIDLKSDALIGVEALLRWKHPERGILNAAQFIDYIEKSSIATELFDWVIEESIDQLSIWEKKGLILSVSVNISIEHITSSGFIGRLKKILSLKPLERPSMLEFEIKESGKIDNFSDLTKALHICKRLGIEIAFDNFGSGYLSLSSFWQIPVGRIKIDPSFVRAMHNNADHQAIVKAAIGIGTGLGRQVVASGIESQDIADELLSYGCDEGEGFGIAPPMSSEDLSQWAHNWKLLHP